MGDFMREKMRLFGPYQVRPHAVLAFSGAETSFLGAGKNVRFAKYAPVSLFVGFLACGEKKPAVVGAQGEFFGLHFDSRDGRNSEAAARLGNRSGL